MKFIDEPKAHGSSAPESSLHNHITHQTFPEAAKATQGTQSPRISVTSPRGGPAALNVHGHRSLPLS